MPCAVLLKVNGMPKALRALARVVYEKMKMDEYTSCRICSIVECGRQELDRLESHQLEMLQNDLVDAKESSAE